MHSRVQNRPGRQPEPDDPWDAFLAPEDDEDLGDPPPTSAQRETPSVPPEDVTELGPPPADAMAGAKWAYQVSLRLAHVAFRDPNISPETREKRVMKLLGGAAKHMTDAMRFDVAQAIERDRQQIEAKKRGRAQARLEAAQAPPDTAKIIPIRRDG